MKTACKTIGNTTHFVIRELEKKYHDAAKDLYYTEFEDGFAKDFPADTPNLDRIFHNFELYAEEMILQAARVHPVPWEKALKTFLKIIKDSNVDWWLVGSTALAVRGIDVKPRDIDLVIAESDCTRLGDLLIDYVVEPVLPSEGWIARWFGRTFINARIEWVAGVLDIVDSQYTSDFGPTAAKRREVVRWNGTEIRVPPLELQLQINERRGLIDRVEKVKLYQQAQSRQFTAK